LAALAAVPATDRPAARAADKPNILFIYTDDQSHRTVGCYRDEGAWPWVRTPNIDRLAAEGVRFTTAYGASWCSPSRACVLTGLLPHGIRGMKLNERREKNATWKVLGEGYDPAVARFWPEKLRKAGYQTAMIGKWHLGQNAGHSRLWDHSVVWDQNSAKGDWYNDPGLAIDGAAPKAVPGYSTDLYTRFAADFVRRRHDQPWLLWLCYNAPHLPNHAHPRHRELYRDADVPVPVDVFGPRPDKPGYMRQRTMFQRAPDGSPLHGKTPLPETVRSYNRLVSAVDDGVGELLRALAETGQLDHTLIVFTSDQGFAWGEHGFAWKTGPYDACLRMPLIFRLPGQVAKAGVCRQPVSIVDLAPTLLGFAGVPLPWEMHGHDLRPLLRTPDSSADRPLLMEHFHSRFGPETDRGETGGDLAGGVPYWLFLRRGKYKYIRTLVPDEIEELYDLEADPQELKNLALDASQRPVLDDYRAHLRAELRRTAAGFVDNLPPPRH
jgi:arylsulfatase A-like enzyme